MLLVAGGLAAKEKKKISRTVTGQVLDKNENGVARATVTLTDLQTGKKLAIYSSDDGHYEFTDLNTGHDYEVQASHQGASSETRKVSSFDNRIRFVINLKIPPPNG